MTFLEICRLNRDCEFEIHNGLNGPYQLLNGECLNAKGNAIMISLSDECTLIEPKKTIEVAWFENCESGFMYTAHIGSKVWTNYRKRGDDYKYLGKQTIELEP